MAGADATLSGITVWVTRPTHQAGALCRMIEQRNGRPLPLPVLVIRPYADAARAAQDRGHLAAADMMIFISKNAVIHALERFPHIADTTRGKAILAVGEATARGLQEAGFERVIQAGRGGSAALLQLPILDAAALRGKRVVILRGQGGREELRQRLLARGAVVDYLEVYRRDKPDISPADVAEFWHDQGPDAVIITSVAGLDNLVELTPPAEHGRLLKTPLVVMSERVRQHATAVGFKRLAVATDNTDAGLVEALLEMGQDLKK